MTEFYAATVVAAALAVWMIRARPAYRPIAWLLCWEVAQDLVRRLLQDAVLAPHRELYGTPYTGAARVAFHAHQALTLSWPAGVAALALWVLAKRGPKPVAVAYAITVGTAAALYPWLRQARLETFYAGVEVACVLACGWSVATFLRPVAPAVLVHQRMNGGGPLHDEDSEDTPAPPTPRRRAEAEHLAVAWIAIIELMVLLGPHLIGGVFAWWPAAQQLYLVMHVGLIAGQGVSAWTHAK